MIFFLHNQYIDFFQTLADVLGIITSIDNLKTVTIKTKERTATVREVTIKDLKYA